MNLNKIKKGKYVKVYSIEFEDELLTKIKDIDETNNIVKIEYKEDIFSMKPKLDERVSVKIPSDDALYYFNTKVLAVYEDECYFTVKLPNEIHKKQDRNFVRVNINLSLNLIGERHKTKAVSTNISGGGICFFCKTHFDENQIVEVEFKNTFGKVFTGIRLIVKHIKVLPNNIFEYGAEFFELEEGLREELISYLFELELRKELG